MFGHSIKYGRMYFNSFVIHLTQGDSNFPKKTHSPGLLNSLAGLLSTLASIYGTQGGKLGTTSLSTLIVTGSLTGVFGLLTGIYLLWFVRRVKAKHDREVGMERRGKHGEGLVDVSTRQAS